MISRKEYIYIYIYIHIPYYLDLDLHITTKKIFWYEKEGNEVMKTDATHYAFIDSSSENNFN